MSLRRAAEGSRVVRLTIRIRDRLASRFEPLTRRLDATDRALLQVVHGSRLHRWFTTDPDPEPIVIDLRETYTTGPVIALLDRVASAADAPTLTATVGDLVRRIVAAPARAAGAVLCLAFSASLLATIAAGDLTAPVYLFHALGLGLGLIAFRERRDFEALAEAPVWGALLAIFAPPPAPDDEG
jgi:hypothetical protein